MKGKVKNKLSAQEVHESISQILGDFGKGLENSNLTDKELDSIENSLEDLEMEAYKTKLGLEMHFFSKKGKELPSKDYLVKMLNILPPQVPVDFLPELTAFILENWRRDNVKVAA